MMRAKTIEKIIRDFIAKELTLNPEKIGLEDNLVNDLHADSMDIVNVVTAIESRFKIKFPDDTQIPYEGYTLNFLVEGVQRALREKSPVRKAARAAKTAEKVAEEKARQVQAQVKEKRIELEEKIEERVEEGIKARRASRKGAAAKAAKEEEPVVEWEKPAQPEAEETPSDNK